MLNCLYLILLLFVSLPVFADDRIIELRWDENPVVDHVLDYDYETRVNGSAWSLPTVIISDIVNTVDGVVSDTLTLNLQPCDVVEARIRARNIVGYSDFSANAVAITPPCTIPGTVTNIIIIIN